MLALTNLRIVDPVAGSVTAVDERGGVLVDGDRIAAVGPKIFADGPPEGAQRIDGEGACLAPGLVDLRVHLREPGAEHKEDIAGAVAVAASGGVTTLGVLPNTDPVVDDVAVIEFIRRRFAAAGEVAVHCFGAATKGAAGAAMSEIGLLSQAGAIGFTDGDRPLASATILGRLLKYATAFDAIIVQRPNDPEIGRHSGMNAGELAMRLGLPGIPAEAEAIMLARDLSLVEMTGGRYHASLVSTAAAVALIGAAKAKGFDVTCDTAPPYFALTEAAVGDYRTFAKLEPPLRNEADRQAVRAGLVDGTIDFIVSDHAAQDAESKRLPFAQAEPGGVGLETLLPLTLELVDERTLDLPRALAAVTCAPARRFGIAAGTLAVGARADLVLFDPDAAIVIHSEGLASKSKNTPFDGRETRGAVHLTVAGGRIVYQPARAAAA